MVTPFPHHATNQEPLEERVAEAENIVVETAERIFADFADAQTINRDKTGGWKAPLWQALSDAGLPLSWVGEELGGSGASLAEGFAVLNAAGRFRWRAAGGNHARRLAAGAGQNRFARRRNDRWAPAGPKDRIALDAGGTLSGRARGVPFARDAQTHRYRRA